MEWRWWIVGLLVAPLALAVAGCFRPGGHHADATGPQKLGDSQTSAGPHEQKKHLNNPPCSYLP